MRKITVLGSTGSIGQQTLALLDNFEVQVDTLVAHKSVELLAQQAKKVGCRHAVIADPTYYKALKEALAGTDITVAAGQEAVTEAAARPCDWTLSAMVGMAALQPTLKALEQGKTVAIANKESLVVGGHLIQEAVKRFGAALLPVDSEHNAIFQILADSFPTGSAQAPDIERIILTASGGPFRTTSLEALAHVTKEKALCHPNWSMGAKITIDSATLMNKGLELIEACHLFQIREEKVHIWVHPESIIHGLVEFVDKGMLAALSLPDMMLPISYALAWPKRQQTSLKTLDLPSLGQLTFEHVQEEKFPAPRLCRQAFQAQKGRPTQLNAVNEVAVAAFLEDRLSFLGIAALVEEALAQLPSWEQQDLESLLAIDQEARLKANSLIECFSKTKNFTFAA